jgi:NADP-dependent 3-hydroxy acid dehydrogenase YdfG
MVAKIYLVKGDLSKETDLNKIVKFAKSKLKYFDCLINNASLFENDKLENFTTDSWGETFKNKFKNTLLYCLKNLQKILKARITILLILLIKEYSSSLLIFFLTL